MQLFHKKNQKLTIPKYFHLFEVTIPYFFQTLKFHLNIAHTSFIQWSLYTPTTDFNCQKYQNLDKVIAITNNVSWILSRQKKRLNSSAQLRILQKNLLYRGGKIHLNHTLLFTIKCKFIFRNVTKMFKPITSRFTYIWNGVTLNVKKTWEGTRT